MKKLLLFNLTSIILIACSTLSLTKDTIKNNFTENSFTAWPTDSIKTFLLGSWLHLGKITNNQIIPDTTGRLYSNGTSKQVVIKPSGKFHVYKFGLQKKQKGIPQINLNFKSGISDFEEWDCYLPKFKICDGGCQFPHTTIRLDSNKFFLQNIGPQEQINFSYLNQDLIVIMETVFVRTNKWSKYKNLP